MGAFPQRFPQPLWEIIKPRQEEKNMTVAAESSASQILEALGIAEENAGAFCGEWLDTRGQLLESVNPTTGEVIATVRSANAEAYERVAATSLEAFQQWRLWPAPRRGEVVRQLGVELRRHKDALGRLVTLEMGKILSEGLGEVQEMIDMVDLAVGMSRQLHGLTMHSERAEHRMYEQWQPLGPVGIITAFNFPVAVWAWNATVAAVCGDSMIWKPSAKTPLCALAVTRIAEKVLADNGAPPIFNLAIGNRREVGQHLVADRRVPLISATGSVSMGRKVGQVVAERLGRNRRLFLQKGIAAEVKRRLIEAYASIRIGDPMDPQTLMGPLVDQQAVTDMQQALKTVQEQGGRILYGGSGLERPGCFVEPTLVEADTDMPITCEETFAPILYLFEFDQLKEAIEMHNSVPQGLSSSIFTRDLLAAERFLSPAGSDCGIANVNIGTSGAEIGGAFGGEKDTGGGREAGSDAWKTYMRRQTCTINYGSELPLAQGVEFDVS
jgi:aldehyde dehydrogenase (NAD+)